MNWGILLFVAIIAISAIVAAIYFGFSMGVKIMGDTLFLAFKEGIEKADLDRQEKNRLIDCIVEVMDRRLNINKMKKNG